MHLWYTALLGNYDNESVYDTYIKIKQNVCRITNNIDRGGTKGLTKVSNQRPQAPSAEFAAQSLSSGVN